LDLDDLASQAITRCLEKHASLSRKLVRHIAINMLRWKKRQEAVQALYARSRCPHPHDYEESPTLPGSCDLDSLLSSLPPRHQQLLILHFASGHSYEYIATYLCTSPSQIQNKVKYALEKLRKKLERRDD
jgi:RNA polymerase sigma factor (sigma-70 family)